MSFKIYSAYDRPVVEGLSFEGEVSLTKQCFKDECDINHILKKYDAHTLAEAQRRNPGSYGDFVTGVDYRTALDQISEARALFDALPAKVRARFDNDPGFFLDFVQNPSNVDEMVALGLASKPAHGQAQPAHVDGNVSG